MRFRVRFALYCYLVMVTISALKLVFFALASKVFPLDGILRLTSLLYTDLQCRWIIGGAGAALLIFNYLIYRTIVGEHTRGKTIAFDNPSGRVFVSLTAMEDLVRRLLTQEPEVKDVRASITARKKRIDVDTRVVLNTDGNIPDLTARLQETARQRIEDMLPSDHTVLVRVYIVKIISENKPKGPKEKSSDRPESSFPFQGYRL